MPLNCTLKNGKLFISHGDVIMNSMVTIVKTVLHI